MLNGSAASPVGDSLELRDECIDTHIEEIDKLDFPGYFLSLENQPYAPLGGIKIMSVV
jgi:hypothetical protein